METWEEFQKIFGEEFIRTKEALKAVVLSYLKDIKVPFRAYNSMRNDGIPLPTSTFYNVIKELEKEGLIEKTEEGYVLSERGIEFLKNNEDVVREARAFGKRVNIADVIGMIETLKLIASTFKLLDKMNNEEIGELARAFGELNSKLRPLIANKII